MGAMRLGFPKVDGNQLLECLKELLRVDRQWVPASPGSCLYIRPVLLECGQVIGTFEPTECLIVAFCAPSGSYFGPGGIRPIRMMLNETDVRAAPGGVGWCKHSGNYAPTFVPVKAARAKACACGRAPKGWCGWEACGGLWKWHSSGGAACGGIGAAGGWRGADAFNCIWGARALLHSGHPVLSHSA